ncbi:CHAT domain-containing protein [Lunatibacter salilacus]|uniref:CHAT domain-containing protein n=1 Tax=Lunatibacter salilacus TaxID=2483804 RepID=UPI00131B36C7|nr:CHAT domain-containing tetratricopeptide repeat protein [Lunatibacter salilacus]
MNRLCFIWLFISIYPICGVAQDVDAQLSSIQKALSDEDPVLAKSIFDRETEPYISNRDFLNLSYFIPFAGYIADAEMGSQSGMDAVHYWLDFIKKESSDPRELRQAYLEIHTYYIKAGKPAMAYEANETALAYTNQIPDHRPAEWAVIESNLGVISNQMGNPEKARSHTLKAKEGYEQDPKTSPVNYFNLLNDLGARYWFSAMWDSAEYYWQEGIEYLDKMEPTPTNQYYRRAMIEGNLGAVYDVKGEVRESIRRVKSSIANTQYFIDNALDDPKRERAFLSLFHGSMNLALVYKSIGNYQEALRLQEHTLKAKEKFFPPGHPEITESLIHVGQTHRFVSNYGEAKVFLAKALKELEKADGDYYMQFADVHYTLALIHESEKNISLAKHHYLMAKDHFEKAYREKFDFVYLDFLGNAAEFFSKNNEPQYALNWSKLGLDYISKVNGRSSMSGFLQVLNQGRVYYNLGEFQNALIHANESLTILDERLNQAESGIDSIRINYDKPQSILLSEKSQYELNPAKSIANLEHILKRLLDAMEILEKRKSYLSESEDLTVLVAQNEDLMDFIKKIQLELYEKTGDKKYLDDLIAVQEASVYSRIRTQLNQHTDIRFAGVPKNLQDQESLLKKELNELFDGGGDLSEYHRLSSEWESFLEKLRLEFPDYYHMRYAEISPENMEIPFDAQIVRYFFVEEKLKAVVFSNGKKKLFHLDFDPELIPALHGNWDNPRDLGKITHALYQQLWEPFALEFDKDRVLVIPSRVLFNLNFDVLTESDLVDYSEYSSIGLLGRHDISYHYSLRLLNGERHSPIPTNYIAFAPGFMDSMKDNYLNSAKDSLSLDKAYLSLLPQPFSIHLAKRASELFSGKSYVYEQSTPEVFRKYAGNNKIIHIATHAESNNISPAFSRLIFAKSDKPEEDNSVYAYEIYNTEMKAHLTVLTACETGKPIYKPGEGMISLAHAFQYSGSESLLTSLWRIDEKSSMEITEHFLAFLSEGMAKDKALKQAKLKYLSDANGRTLSPQYWAGLVLIGDPEPIEGLGPNKFWMAWVFILLTLSGIVVYLVRKKRGKFGKTSDLHIK